MSDFHQIKKTLCLGSKILMACKPTSSDSLTVLAAGPRENVFKAGLFFVHISHHLLFIVENIIVNWDILIESLPFPCSFYNETDLANNGFFEQRAPSQLKKPSVGDGRRGRRSKEMDET